MQLTKPALVLALLVAGCSVQASTEETASGTTDPTHASAVRTRQAAKVRTAQVERRTMRRILETTAPVESLAEIQVVAEATGRVDRVLVDEGQRVQVGDLLASLDDRDQRTAVAEAAVAVSEAEAAVERSKIAELEAAGMVRTAQLALQQAERDHARNLKLAEGATTSALSEQAVETSGLARDRAEQDLAQAELAQGRSAVDTRTAEAALERAKLTKERAERDLERTRIEAPIEGVVALRSIEPGRNVTLGQAVFELVDLDRLRVVFYRPQRELELFRGSGVSTLTATTEAAPGRSFRGTIARVAPTVDRTSGAFRVTARLEPRSQPGEDTALVQARLLPGMLLRLAVVTGEHPDTLVVPKRALRREGSAVFVLAVDGQGDAARARRVPVEEGYADDDSVEVLPLGDGALAEGDPVIVVGGRDLEDGDAVLDEGLADDAPGEEIPAEESPAEPSAAEPGE